VRDVADSSLRQEFAGGEREQLAFARGDSRAEESDPQREVLRDGPRSGYPAAQEFSGKDFGGSTMMPPSASEATRPSARRAIAFIQGSDRSASCSSPLPVYKHP
jgi:hypothetical protein